MGLRKLSQTEIGEKASPIQPVNRHLVGKIISSWEYDNCLNQNGLCGGPRTESTKLHIWERNSISGSKILFWIHGLRVQL